MERFVDLLAAPLFVQPSPPPPLPILLHDRTPCGHCNLTIEVLLHNDQLTQLPPQVQCRFLLLPAEPRPCPTTTVWSDSTFYTLPKDRHWVKQ